MNNYDLRLKYKYVDWEFGDIPKGSMYRVENVVMGKNDFEVRMEGLCTRTLSIPLKRLHMLFERVAYWGEVEGAVER